MSDFDSILLRKDTDSLKFDFAVARGMPEDVLPLWVADMDFPAPPCVLKALEAKVRHGIFGYSDGRADYFQALSGWFSKRFSWEIQPDWLIKTPGVVYAIALAIKAFTQPGDGVLIQPPVYYPFSEAILSNKRALVENPLVFVDGRYVIDFDDFEEKIKTRRVKLFLLCSPHNPVGRVWTEAELERLGEICLRHGVIIASDEIHQDFIYPGFKHHVFASLRPEFTQNSITFTAPTKTFNLAALQISNILIPNPRLRALFRAELTASGYSQPNVMGITACRAAYAQGEAWLEELLAYLQGNLKLLETFLHEKFPNVRLIPTQGTYLCWLDIRGLGLPAEEVHRRIVHQAKLWLDDGRMFGLQGEGFQRINIACPRSVLTQALEQLASAFS